MSLDVSVRIETPSGWLELEDSGGGYELANDALGAASVTHRKVEISSEWLEGAFVARSVRENVSEAINVYVAGANPHQLATRVAALTEGFDQLNYQMVVRFANSQETWECNVADYTITTKAEFRHATVALVAANVPHLPSPVRVEVFP